jgi:hypothetical protein
VLALNIQPRQVQPNTEDEFWPDAIRAVKAANPRFVMLAEVLSQNSCVHTNGINSVIVTGVLGSRSQATIDGI